MAARKAKPTKSPRPEAQAGQSKATATSTKRSKGRRRRYSDAERQRILETARREGLSGPKAAKRFGISTLTFYNWRKKAGRVRRRGPGRPPRAKGGFSDQISAAIRAKVRAMLPHIIDQEIGLALGWRSRGR
jgi:transposase-like protein